MKVGFVQPVRRLVAAIATVAVAVVSFQVVSPRGVAAAEGGVGHVEAWGSDWGNGQPIGPMQVTQVTSGESFNLALKLDGTIEGWGFDNYQQVSIARLLTDVTQISANGLHALALKGDGTVVAWGENQSGQNKVPAGLADVTQVAAGGHHSLALRRDGTVVAWGNDGQGQASVPAGLTGVTRISGGALHSLALKSDGTVVAWGHNEYGQTDVPPGLTDVTQISGGAYLHSLALKRDGTVVAWGNNTDGEADVPAGLTDVVQVAAGYGYSLALKSDGTVVAWGRNTQGHTSVPSGLTDVVQIAAGVHSLAIVEDTDPPETTLDSGPSGTITEPGPVFEFSSDETAASFECRVDDGAFASCASPHAPEALDNGPHTFEVRAVDAAGNVDATPASRDFIVEPMVRLTAAGSTFAENVGSVDLRVTRLGNTEVPASVDYRLEPGTATTGTDFTLTPGTLTFAAGETSKTIPVTITDDRAAEVRETIGVSLRDPSSGNLLASTTMAIAASDQRPDALISTRVVRGYAGNDIYNARAARQTKTLVARRNQARTVYVRVSNDGNVRNTFVVKGSAAWAGSVVTYHSGSTNVTRAMRSPRGWKVALRPGASRLIKVRIAVRPRARIGSIQPATVSARWVGDGVRQDVVRAVVEVGR